MTFSRAQGRDLTLASLALLQTAATASRAPAGELARQLETLRDSGLRSVLTEASPALPGIPGWLSGENSGLALILNAATQPSTPDDAPSSVPADVTRLLDDDLVGDLLVLADELLAGGGPGGLLPPHDPAVVLVTKDGCVATSLWSAEDPASRHPWFSPVDSLTHLPARTVAAVRRALSPFESLADVTVPAILGAGYLWPPGVPGRPVLGLRAALTALAGTAKLGPVPPSLVAIGDSTDDGDFAALSPDEVSAYAAAVDHLASDVLVPTGNGWQLTRADKTVTVMRGRELSLDVAAHLVWGEEWEAWKRRQHRAELIRLGWVPVEWAAVPPGQPVPETDIHQVDSLHTIFLEGRKIAVLGGTVASGKSVIVRRLAARLARQHRRPPLIRVIASMFHQLPDRHTALRVGQHALGMDESVSGQRRLLVLEDLYPVSGGNVDGLLPYLSSSLDASVLAVLQYDVNSNEEWKTDHLNVVTAVVGRRAMREFVERLCREHPDRLNRSAGLAELDRLHPTRDVGRLIRIMAEPEETAGREPAGPALDTALAERFRSLDPAAREALATAAVWSLARGGVGPELIDAVDAEAASAFGAQLTADGDQYRIPSPDDCRSILTSYGALEAVPGHPLQPTNDVLAGLLLPRLMTALRDGKSQVIPLLEGIRLYRSNLCAEVIRQAWKAGPLREWVQRAPLPDAARLLVSLNVLLSDGIVRNSVRIIVDRLREQTDWVTIQEALVILRCFRSYLSEITRYWREVRIWIRDQVSAILDEASGTPDERFQLLRRVDSFNDLTLKQLVAERSAQVLPGIDPSRVDDYYLVRRVRAMQDRAQHALKWEQQPFPIDQEEPVQALLSTELPDNAGFHVLTGRMMLLKNIREDNWEVICEAHRDRFVPSLSHTSAHEFSRAIDELHKFGTTYANGIFKSALSINNHRRVPDSRLFFDAIRKLLYHSTPMEAADIIRSVSGVHARTAYEFLNPSFDVPDETLATVMADRAAHQGDVKAAGMLLSVAHLVDDIYLTRSAGFAQRFGECLGKERILKMLRDDPRPSIKYYLIKGLWDAQVSFRRECLEAVRDVVMDGTAGDPRPWGPRLALQVGADVEMGEEFLTDLRDHLPLRVVFRGMEPGSSPEAQVEFHRLARALYPEAADQYARQFDEKNFLSALATAAPVTAIECCREVGRTLADAGYHDGGRDMVRVADDAMGEPHAWANRLARTRTGEQLAQALNIFLDIDRLTARSVVASLSELDFKPDVGEEESLLIWKARQAMFDSPVAATALLSSLEDVDAGLGGAVYECLRQDPVLMQIFGYELQLLQWPSVQYVAARQLAGIGVLPGRADTEWMTAVATVKQRFVRVLASPRLLTDIIRMLGVWQQSWADQAVRSIDHHRLLSRLRLGLSRDISPTITLAGLEYDYRHPAGAEQVLDALSHIAPSRIVESVGLRDACQLLELTRMLRPADTSLLTRAIDAFIGSRLDRAVVLDERLQWLEIGYAGHCLAATGSWSRIATSRAPRTAPNTNHPAEVIWGLWHLPEGVWRQRSLSAATGRLFADPQASGSSLFCVLAAASLTGRADEVADLAADQARFARLSFRQLRVLHELARRDTALAGLLTGFTEQIQQRLNEPAAAVSWDSQRLKENLFRLAKEAGNPSAASPRVS